MLRAAQILERLSQNPDDGVAANDLLEELGRGYPIEILKAFLESINPRKVRVGVWIASELGAKAASLVDIAASLLSHPDRYVRFYAVDFIFSCASSTNVRPTAEAVCRIDDEDSSVRWKVMRLLAHVPLATIKSVDNYVTCGANDDAIRNGLRQLLDETTSGAIVHDMIRSSSAITRRFGAICAFRSRERLPNAYTQACESADADVQGFVRDCQ